MLVSRGRRVRNAPARLQVLHVSIVSSFVSDRGRPRIHVKTTHSDRFLQVSWASLSKAFLPAREQPDTEVELRSLQKSSRMWIRRPIPQTVFENSVMHYGY